MDAFPVTNQTPLVSLLWRAMQKARIPCQRNGNRASVGQINNERVFGNSDPLRNSCLCFNH